MPNELLNKYPVIKIPTDFILDNYKYTYVSLPDKIAYPQHEFKNNLFEKYESIISISGSIGFIGLIYSFISLYYNDTSKHLIIWSTYGLIWTFIIIQVSNANKINKRKFEIECKRQWDTYRENELIRTSGENINSSIIKINSSTLSEDKKGLKYYG